MRMNTKLMLMNPSQLHKINLDKNKAHSLYVNTIATEFTVQIKKFRIKSIWLKFSQ